MNETLVLRQSSMQRTDSAAHKHDDVLAAIPDPATRWAPAVVGFTELDATLRRLVADRCAETGYLLHRASTVGLALHPKLTPLELGHVDVLDGLRAARGGHSPRPILYATCRTPKGNVISVHEAHWVTDAPTERREAKRRALSQAMADQVRLHSKGRRISFWMGDTNEDEGRPEHEVQRPLTRGGLVSIYDALGTHPTTHGRTDTIDVVGHFDRDGRVVPRRVTVGDRRHSDHRQVDGRYTLLDEVPAPVDPDDTITQRVVQNARRRGVKVLHHDQWGSRHRDVYAWRRENKPAKVPADTLVQHITVTLDTGPLTGDFRRDMRTVERIGYERFRSGVSYNFVVDMRTGMVGVGMPLDAKGTHTINDKSLAGFSLDQNYWARAIAVLGMEDTPLSDKAAEAIAQLEAAMVDEGALTRGFDYMPHSAFAHKSCPCDSTRRRMASIRKRAMEVL